MDIDPPSLDVLLGARKAKLTFIEKLVHMLDHVKPSIMQWSRDGRSFLVHDQKRLSDEVLVHYLRTSNFSSFVRQLNYYGFRKTTRPSSHTFEFRHDQFIRNKPNVVKGIRRRAGVDGTAAVNQAQAETEALRVENQTLKARIAALEAEVARLGGMSRRVFPAPAAMPTTAPAPTVAPAPVDAMKGERRTGLRRQRKRLRTPFMQAQQQQPQHQHQHQPQHQPVSGSNSGSGSTSTDDADTIINTDTELNPSASSPPLVPTVTRRLIKLEPVRAAPPALTTPMSPLSAAHPSGEAAFGVVTPFAASVIPPPPPPPASSSLFANTLSNESFEFGKDLSLDFSSDLFDEWIRENPSTSGDHRTDMADLPSAWSRMKIDSCTGVGAGAGAGAGVGSGPGSGAGAGAGSDAGVADANPTVLPVAPIASTKPTPIATPFPSPSSSAPSAPPPPHANSTSTPTTATAAAAAATATVQTMIPTAAAFMNHFAATVMQLLAAHSLPVAAEPLLSCLHDETFQEELRSSLLSAPSGVPITVQ